MKTMDNEPDPVNGPLDEVYAFAEKMGAHGVYNPTSARLKTTATKRMVSVLADNEPFEAQWVLDNIDALANRLARLGNENPETMRTYRSRAASLLSDFLEYKKAPLDFTKKASEERTPRREGSPKPKKEPEQVSEAAKPPNSSRMRSYPLGDGREIEFVMPDGMTIEQCLRFSLHLVTMAVDFDPMRPEQVQAFGLLKAQ